MKEQYKKKPVYEFIKRLADICASALGIILLSWLLIIVAIIIKCTSKGPVFFKDKRVGKGGKEIHVYKFRSMYVDAESRLKEYLTPEQLEQWYKERKIDNDPRITKVGKLLRKTSLDEFPQFLNVLVGQMSMIGPRPVVLDEVENYGKNKEKFLSVRPGLTGYWASNGRSNVSYKERMKMELFYVDHCCIRLDIQIIWNTIITVIKREGAK